MPPTLPAGTRQGEATIGARWLVDLAYRGLLRAGCGHVTLPSTFVLGCATLEETVTAPTDVGTKVVSYLRVSTAKQGHSGLGLEAQREAVRRFVGSERRVVSEFVEVESGKHSARPQLAKALAACRAHRATLVVAKLDRLSRNAAFLLNLRDADVPFIAADQPHANRMTVGLLAVVAESEAESISERTKAALAAAKARGVKLGNPQNLTLAGRRKGSARGVLAKQAKAARRAADLAPVIERLGPMSRSRLAEALNTEGVPAPRGGTWTTTTVCRLLARLAEPVVMKVPKVKAKGPRSNAKARKPSRRSRGTA